LKLANKMLVATSTNERLVETRLMFGLMKILTVAMVYGYFTVCEGIPLEKRLVQNESALTTFVVTMQVFQILLYDHNQML